jgi:hypothetical protein
VHVRRALLLFAIVLGLAALATSVSRPRDGSRDGPVERPRATPRPLPPGPAARARIAFEPAAHPPTRTLRAGRPAEVRVEVRQPGLVELPGLGLSDDAEPGTPATFEVLSNEPGSYAVLLTPAGSDERRRIGTLKLK